MAAIAAEITDTDSGMLAPTSNTLYRGSWSITKQRSSHPSPHPSFLNTYQKQGRLHIMSVKDNDSV